ncbi:MAG: hypothetical protein RMK02_06765, partial [Burkholderiales bacterium]|nr:hypothetical protein [Burkholderiales bacterium]
ERREVPVRYVLAARACGHTCHEYGFALGPYDRLRPVTIDPLLQATYVGGATLDEPSAIALHPNSGEILVLGRTNSTDLPNVSGAAQGSFGGVLDAFIARIHPSLTSFLQITYLGGPGNDYSRALAVHPASGEIYVTGFTDSSTGFPGINSSSPQQTLAGAYDMFITRFNSTLTNVLQSTYVGSDFGDDPRAIAIHPLSGDVYVAGGTASSSFPGTLGGAFSNRPGGSSVAVVVQFSATLTTLKQATYLQPPTGGYSFAFAMAIHPADGSVYVAGNTTDNLIATTGAAQTTFGGGPRDAFVARLHPSLTAIQSATLLGGNGEDFAWALAIHPGSLDIYVAGDTSSSNFPNTASGAQPGIAGGKDGFLARLNPTLSNVLQATYFGGSADEVLHSVAVHPISGAVYVSGEVSGVGGSPPGISGGLQTTSSPVFLAYFQPSLQVLGQATFFGGSGTGLGYGVFLLIHPTNGQLYLMGKTAGGLSGTSGGAQGTFGGGGADVFVARLTPDLSGADLEPDSFVIPAQHGVAASTLRISSPVPIMGLGAPASVSVSGAAGNAVCVANSPNCATCSAWTTTALVANNQFLCVRHTSASTVPGMAVSHVLVGSSVAQFVTTTGASGVVCNLDFDDDGQVLASKEGLVLARALLGFSPAAAVVGTGITQAQWEAKRTALRACGMLP